MLLGVYVSRTAAKRIVYVSHMTIVNRLSLVFLLNQLTLLFKLLRAILADMDTTRVTRQHIASKRHIRVARGVVAVALAVTATWSGVGVSTAATPSNLPIEPVGYNVVDGKLDTNNPIANAEIQKDPGFSSTPPSGQPNAQSPLIPQAQNLVGAAKFPEGAAPNVVIGNDDRKEITDTKQAPSKWVGKLHATTQSGGSSYCTASLISKDTVITAGHCVAKGQSKWTFAAGENKGQQPYGTAAAKQIWYDKKYGENGHDWAVIKLDSAVGEKTGWFGMNVPDTQKLVDQYATVIGYPGDKDGDTQWADRNKVMKVTDRQVVYQTDTFNGQSGSSVVNDTSTIFAIHTGGKTGENYGTILTGELFNVCANVAAASPAR